MLRGYLWGVVLGVLFGLPIWLFYLTQEEGGHIVGKVASTFLTNLSTEEDVLCATKKKGLQESGRISFCKKCGMFLCVGHCFDTF